MNRSVLAVIVGFLLLGAHFTFCMWSACTLLSEPQKKVHHYTSPLFEQPWVVSACDFPTSTLELEFRTLEANQWEGWKDATASFAYDATSPAERLEQFINEEMRWQITHNFYSENKRPELKRILESSAYAKALHYVLSMNYHVENSVPDSVQLRMAIHFIPSPDQAYSEQIAYLNFPTYGPAR